MIPRPRNRALRGETGFRRLATALIMLLLSGLIGTQGFMYFESYTFTEAIYMTVITLSTVGFEEVRPLSNEGMIFASVYILINVGIFAYVVSVLITYIFEGEFNKIYRSFLSFREMRKLNNHVIVCGFGRNGRKTCEELKTNNTNFVVIEKDPEIVQNVSQLGFIVKLGDATEDETLRSVGIDKADTLITTLPNDAANVFITLTAKQINPEVTVISRASDENSVSKLTLSGASHVVMPDNLGGMHMAQLITKPYVIEFLEMMNGASRDFILEEFVYDQFKPDYRDKSIKQIGIRENTGATVIAYKEKGENFVFNPPSEVTVNENDVFIILGAEECLNDFRDLYIK